MENFVFLDFDCKLCAIIYCIDMMQEMLRLSIRKKYREAIVNVTAPCHTSAWWGLH